MGSREILIKNRSQIEPKHNCRHEPYEYKKFEVTERSVENQCYVAIYEIPPQKSNYPYHYHLKNEEVFYIISGTGTLQTPDGDKTISAGDVIVCPPSEKGTHRITNHSQSETLVYLDVDTVNSPEVVFYPHSDKLGVIVTGKTGEFYKRNSKVDYYEGE